MHRAFTLLELLLATALAAMLMILILTVTASIRRTQVDLTRAQSATEELTQLLRLLGEDLVHATAVKAQNDFLSIAGYNRLDPVDLDGRHGPAQTTYRIIVMGGHSCLVRQQIQLDSQSNQESQVELLLVGVKHFDVESTPRSTGESQMPSTRPAFASLSLVWEDPKKKPEQRMVLLD